MTQSEPARGTRRLVIKVGSALLTRDGQGLDAQMVATWVAQLAALRGRGVEVVLVSSGAIAEGMRRLGWSRRPLALHELQAAAAVGQMGLVHVYEAAFRRYEVHTAQVLLTHEDFSDRRRYLNARSTLRTLLALGVVPIVNENDTVSNDEIRLGDNDTLAGLAANLVEAALLVILTDQEGLYTRDPRVDARATLVRSARAGDPALEAMAGEGGKFGRGGMRTKLQAARLAARSGTATVIASGYERDVIERAWAGEACGTYLAPGQPSVAARKRWLAGQLRVRGRLLLDEGAVRVLRNSGRSLLPVGVTSAEGAFARGELVACLDAERREVARGLVNYGIEETRRIMGRSSEQIFELLGYMDEPELIHRDNLVLME